MNLFVVSFFSGVIFALGLGISGMTGPHRIVGFLDVFGNWQPQLLFTMMGAILVYSIGYRLVIRRPKPLFSCKFHIPTLRVVDKPLALGAVLFGVGWGISGYCPGPALTSLVTLGREPLVFFVSMIAGMHSYTLLQKRTKTRG